MSRQPNTPSHSAHPVRSTLPPPSRRSRPADRIMLMLALPVLGLCFITGGSSMHSGMGVLLAQGIALLLLPFALWHAHQRQRLYPARWPLTVALALLCLPLLQLMPLPEALWRMSPARVMLADDLASFGVDNLIRRWSLTPDTTEHIAYQLLPALALFIVPLATNRTIWKGLLWCCIGLATFTLILAFAQLGVPQDSFLNPFPEYPPSLSGVFANKNHQASALAIGLVLALSMMNDAFLRPGHDAHAQAKKIVCALLVLTLILVLPLVRSRAGLLVAMVACGSLLLASGFLSAKLWRTSRAVRALSVLAVAILAIGVWGAFAWMQSEAALEDSRWIILTTTLRLGLENAPFGSGFGSFVPMFEQATSGALMRQGGYINNAHNEYAQWWFEGGIAAIAVLLAALAVLIAAARRLLERPLESDTRRIGIGAACALLVLLLHSTVDYPMRTPALMAMAGLLAGIVVAAAAPESDRASAAARKRSSSPP